MLASRQHASLDFPAAHAARGARPGHRGGGEGGFQAAGGVGGLLSVRIIGSPLSGGPSGTFHPCYDGNGNITEYLTSSGTLELRHSYGPFGETNVATGSIAHLPYRFSTKPADPTTGYYYYGYRWYNALTGRWNSRDPIGEEGGVNLYGFVGNNGLSGIDRLGLEFYAAFVPAWWELNGEQSGGISGHGLVRDDSMSELFLRLGQRIALESKQAAENNIQILSAMSDQEWGRMTSGGFFVKWMSSFREVDATPDNLSGQEDDVDEVDRTGVSRREVIRWLRHEQGSYAEIFVTGSSSSILDRAARRATEELNSGYEWTSFALIMHHGASGLNFPTGGVALQEGRDAVARVNAKSSQLIACGANPGGVGELVRFIAMELTIDEEECKVVFTPAQVVRGFSRD